MVEVFRSSWINRRGKKVNEKFANAIRWPLTRLIIRDMKGEVQPGFAAAGLLGASATGENGSLSHP